MVCPRCQKTVDPGAIFCGNCGQQLRGAQAALQPAETVTSSVQQTQAAPVPGYAVNPQLQTPQQSFAQPTVHDHGAKAITSFVLAILGLPATLIPIVGIVFGVLAIVFGSLSIRSTRKVFAIIGMSIAVIVLLVSLFFWVRNTQELVREQQTGTRVAKTDSRTLQTIETPCYTTKVPEELNITQTSGGCTFLATSARTGEQQQVKVMNVPQLTQSNLSTAAKADAENVVSSIPGGVITAQHTAQFSNSQAHEFEIKASDGSAGMISYVYDMTSQGNLVIVLHTQADATNSYSLDIIESNWTWL